MLCCRTRATAASATDEFTLVALVLVRGVLTVYNTAIIALELC